MATTLKQKRKGGGGSKQIRRTRTKMAMACSPVVDGLRIKDSCYTPKILLAIRDAFNKDHSAEEKIRESDPEKLWVILKDRFVHCKKEDCWLNAIKDERLRKRIDRYIFAPDKPYEWKKNPNEWLSNYDIMNVLEQYEERYKHFEFIGPTPIDFDSLKHGTCVYNELCKFNLAALIKKGKTKIGIVFNLSPSTSSGSHWVSMFIDTNHKVIFFFDSAGETIPKEIEVFKDRVQAQAKEMLGSDKEEPYDYYENHPQEHQFGNTECGVYSLFFIITMLTGRTELSKGRLSMKRKIELFQHKTIKDEYIEKYRNVYFND
jgi:hypothetical protein